MRPDEYVIVFSDIFRYLKDLKNGFGWCDVQIHKKCERKNFGRKKNEFSYMLYTTWSNDIFLINHSSEIRISCMMKWSDSKFAIFFGKKFRFPYSKYMVNFEAFQDNFIVAQTTTKCTFSSRLNISKKILWHFLMG